MKNFIEKMSSNAHRAAVIDTWNKVGWFEFKELIDSMPARCQAVSDANGLFTKY
jgi:hypothetical protein